MNKLIWIVSGVLWLAASAMAESLSVEDQTRIITAYGIATGQIQSQAAAVADTLPPDKCGTSAVSDFVLNRDRLDPALLASLGVRLEGRPVLPKAYRSPSGRFLIHYDTVGTNAVYQPSVRTLVDSVPDYVVMTARIADTVYTHIIDTLGYPAPPSDGFYAAGGDSAFDVYLLNVGYLYYGLTYIDSARLISANPADTMKATSFLELDNDFQNITPYANRPLDAVRVTMAHEYFHAVQFGIDFREKENYQLATPRQYWMEMSAVWMEDEVYDAINDYYVYLPYFYNYPTVSLQAFGGVNNLHPYAAGVFAKYLAERYGKGIIKDIWLECAARGVGPQFLEACDAAVRAADPPDGSLATAINEFSLWNYFTGPYADFAPAGVGYIDRANYPAIPISQFLTIDQYPQFVAIDSFGLARPNYNGTGYLLLQNLESRSGCYGCVRIDTSANPDTAVAISCDSILLPHEDSLYVKTAVSISCDSVLPIYIGVQTPGLIEWGITVIYLVKAPADSFEIEKFIVPILPVDPNATTWIEIDAYKVNRYKSIAVIISPTSNDYRYYSFWGMSPRIGYAFADSGGVVLPRPSAVLTPYPNPAVVADMGGRGLTFRFQVAGDTSNLNITATPLLAIDIYTVAGDLVKSIQASFSGEDRLGVHAGGLYETTWNMRNAAAQDVASGVYLVYARLFSTPTKRELLAESRVKVALIR
ncbi:MAG: hypothetical protein HY851_01335 [candidate division Zixibacteria bacterium]|nr:hypothetical protein [candidate division Zixibacteria bacterium]